MKASNTLSSHRAAHSNNSHTGLSVDEERLLVVAAHQGRTKALEKLISEHFHIARSQAAQLAKKFGLSDDEEQELMQIALIKIHEAIASFNPESSFRLSAFLTACIRNGLIDELRAIRREKSRRHKTPRHNSQSQTESELDRLPDPRSSGSALQTLRHLLERYLNDEERFVICMSVNGFSLLQIAEMQPTHSVKVWSTIRRRARTRLKRQLAYILKTKRALFNEFSPPDLGFDIVVGMDGKK